ncbi:alpha/beta fold hydrolase [Aureimonas flava]|uniref:Alpha/beta fold hydrolase n=1 Tax=Aureimonas flava TaxID=2320271 RepID=A0A3A1WQM9_9HYPH|nr:alpha/beta hydrolase [Aureimonas flava]RIY02520.1 alpha/beta fold hydrolase [Aureimonas flava]
MSPAPCAPERPALVFLHALGSSRRAFDDVAGRLADRFEVIGVDLPGFGDASPAAGTGVERMVEHVVRDIRDRLPSRWLLAGHSMGGKVASVLAARVLSGHEPLFGLAGIVLLAASPPGPEPMDEARREDMLSWVRDGRPLGPDTARRFIDANVGAPLHEAADARMREDLSRTAPEAWAAWLERGSREDWSGTVGASPLPALVLAGGADGDLGPDGQRRTNMPAYPRGTLEVLEGAGHLLPLERAEAVAEAIERFWDERAGQGPAVPPDYVRLIASPRVSARTRAIFAARILASDPVPPGGFLGDAQRATLRALAERVVPQDGPPIDLAARVEEEVARGRGDGWRPAVLPPDREAYARALDAIDGLAALAPAERDARIAAVAEGRFREGDGALTAEQMAAWFEDARTDLVRQWLAHPATMARIGFDGFANGGDGERKEGYDRLGADEREAWEPVTETVR